MYYLHVKRVSGPRSVYPYARIARDESAGKLLDMILDSRADYARVWFISREDYPPTNGHPVVADGYIYANKES